MTVLTTEPKIDQRPAQHYLGIRTWATLPEMGQGLIPRLHSEIMAYMRENDIAPTGAPFMRFHVINMESKLDVELGWFIADAATGNERVKAGVLPAGRYASLIYTGVMNGMEGNKVLIEWAKASGIQWDRWEDEHGDAFRCRYETYLTDPADEPDMSKWETEVAIKLADQ